MLNLTIKTVRSGSIVYTDKFRSYDSLADKPAVRAAGTVHSDLWNYEDHQKSPSSLEEKESYRQFRESIAF